MADYGEWLSGGGATEGQYGEDGLNLEEQQSYYLQRQERDVVLCLIDCRASMFVPFSTEKEDKSKTASPTKVKKEKSSKSGTVVKEEVETPSDTINSIHSNNKKQSEGTNSNSKTPFEVAMEFVLRFYQNKVITSERDMAALAFFDTEKMRNIYDIQGLYVVNTFHVLGAESVQEVELLLRGGNAQTGGKAYEELKAKVGHRPDTQQTSLDKALWAAQHMFVNLKSKAIKYKRIFLFTNNDNPCDGDALGLTRCKVRALDLAESGVTLEVFGIGVAAEGETGDSKGFSTGGGGSSAVRGIFASASVPTPTVVDSSAIRTVPAREDPHAQFEKERFWEPLISAEGANVSEEQYRGGVYVGSRDENNVVNFDELFTVFKHKVHPQRPSHHCKLTIGMRTDGGALPTIGVSVFHPLMRAVKPKTEVLEGRTNCLLKRKTRLVTKNAATDDAPPGEEEEGEKPVENEEEEGTGGEAVSRDALVYAVPVGGRTLQLTPKEKDTIIQTAAAGAMTGLTIICFKREEDVLLPEHMITRSAFLHFNWAANEEHRSTSIKFFVQLVRSLYAKRRVAIAQYRWRAVSQPRLVALVPTLDGDESVSSQPSAGGSVNHNSKYLKLRPPPVPPLASRPVEGLGFYLVPLPYAEDLREVPPLEQTTLAVKGNTPVLDEEADPLTTAQINLAKEIIRKLTVHYNITAVPNPSLQLIYHVLQQLALRRVDGGGGGAGEAGEFLLADSNAQGKAPNSDTFTDFTLPDEEGLRRYVQLYHQFNTTVLEEGYDADKLCPQPRTATTRARVPAGTDGNDSSDKKVKKEENASSDITELIESYFERNALSQSTVAQLKEYIKTHHINAKGATKKDALVDVVSAHLKKKKK